MDGKIISGHGVTPSVIRPAASGEAALENDLKGPTQFGGKNDLQIQKALGLLNKKAAAKVA